jgi:predicted AAA+ superfamily ATPase
MVQRQQYMQALEQATRRAPVVALLGPRQCGKTTLAQGWAQQRAATYLDLESPRDLNRLANPEMMLGRLPGPVVIDEVQAMPALLPILRVLADRGAENGRFLILGSASPQLVKGASESLAGRVEFVDLHGFDVGEIGQEAMDRLWVRGGFPRSFLADRDADSYAWREGFVRTFLERDLPALGLRISPVALRRFWIMLAHYHGQTWNSSEIGRSLGVSDKTARSYLDVLTQTYMVRQLCPWFENVGKRQVKAPRVYVRDSGLLHYLLSLEDYNTLTTHPKLGASWEGFALEQILRICRPSQAFCWSVHQGAEVDLLVFAAGRRVGVEVKFAEQPKVTRSMHTAIEDLRLDELRIVTPGAGTYPLQERISVHGLRQVTSDWLSPPRRE